MGILPEIAPERGNATKKDGRGPAPYRLVRELLARSFATLWEAAKREWSLIHVFITEPDEPGTCLCGHYPIREHCVLVNRRNGNKVVVGNICVTRVLGFPSEEIFAGLRRIAKNPRAALIPATVEHAYSEGWLTDWERRFCLDTVGRRNLNDRQMAKRVEINHAVLACARKVVAHA